MRAVLLVIVASWWLTNCWQDETVASYGAKEVVWQLVELDGKPYDAHATLSFADEGQLAGQAPCNTYFGEQSAPYPWFMAENIGATRKACPDLAAETAYFEALAAMTLSEVSEETLFLSNDAGREMVFEAQK